MKSIAMIGCCLIAFASMLAEPARAERLGEHPAIIQKRAAASAGYDYASKFYPHPAWLYLLPKQPGEATPDEMVAGRPHGSTGASDDDTAKRAGSNPSPSMGVVGRPVLSAGPVGFEQPSLSDRSLRSDRRGALR